jgi:hypothetical protein
MGRLSATVVPYQGRFLVCRVNLHGERTAGRDHLLEQSALQEARELDAEFAAAERAIRPLDPDAPRQLVLGFYTDEDAA